VSAFDEATLVRPGEPGVFTWSVPDGWQQGRGAWGGLVVGALARAVTATEPDPARTLRTITVQIMAPALVGEHRIVVSAVRLGSAMSTWSAIATDAQGEPVASMVAITGSPRTTDVQGHETWGTALPPSVPSPPDVPRVPGGPPFPVFTQHTDVRPVSGLPFSGGPAETVGWIRLAEPVEPSAVSLLALVDAWWPASLPVLTTMPRIATVSFMATLLVDPSTLESGEYLLHQSFVTAAAQGFTSEHRRLWSADGRLVVDNLQTIVVGS
jgi:hypothetical protein